MEGLFIVQYLEQSKKLCKNVVVDMPQESDWIYKKSKPSKDKLN